MRKRFIALVAVVAFVTGSMSVSAAGLKDIFNAKYYAEQYPDLVAVLGNNEEALYQHFLKYGISEGRVMNPIIDIVKYREAYGDLDAAFGNNWDAYVTHYFNFGVSEKRDNGTDFDMLAYIEAYGDIKETFGNDYAAIAEHYVMHGMSEGRKEASKEVIAAKEAAEKAEEETEENDTVKEDYEKTIKYDDGSWSVSRYDANDNILEQEKYKSDGSIDFYRTYTYDADMVLLESKAYYGSGALKDTTQYNEARMQTTYIYYNEDGTLNYRSESEYSVNDASQLAKRTTYWADGDWCVVYYDEAGEYAYREDYNSSNVMTIKHEIGADGAVYRTFFDDNGVKSQVDDYAPDGSHTTTLYDTEGNVTSTLYFNSEGEQTDSEGNVLEGQE